MSAKRVYRLQRQGDLLWLRAAVGSGTDNSLVMRLLVDTGSSYTVLPAQVLERLGCNCREPLRTTAIVTAGGVIPVPMVAVPWFNCLGVRQEDFPVVALDLPMAAFSNGLLGMDFLRDCQAVIDVTKAEIQVAVDD